MAKIDYRAKFAKCYDQILISVEFTMATPRTFIIIKGEPKALQIEQFSLGDNNVYNVKYKSSQTTFHYRFNDVVWLKDMEWHDQLQCKVFIGGKEQKNVSDIRSFQHGELTHWRITYGNGFVKDYMHGTIYVAESCISDDTAKKSFEYLKRVALVNELGKDEDHGGILSAQYDKIDFIDNTLAIAPYLDFKKYKIKKTKSPSLIFPFGCNGSQEKAVTAAFENQLSVIQGPPGTGKTQTILNIIANIILQGKTVIVVSNNNSATANVQEKLQKYGLDFMVATLGKKDNKESFIENQPLVPDELKKWSVGIAENAKKKLKVAKTLSDLRKVFALQEDLAQSKQEIKDIELEWNHFKQDNQINNDTYTAKPGVKADKYMSLWLQYKAYSEKENIVEKGIFAKLLEPLKWKWMNFIRQYMLGIKSHFDKSEIQSTILELQSLYYIVRIGELKDRIYSIEQKLAYLDAKSLNSSLISTSMDLLKGSIYDKYNGKDRIVFSDVKELKMRADEVLNQYPVILSTTFSARNSLSDSTIYDYIIMDEASQVSIETGALAMTCARNAVIVGDTLQLPNVVTEEDQIKLNAIFNEFKIAKGYDSSKYSFLESVCSIVPDVKQTLLREHYRCHPKIINFCNQKFYGGNLLIMTEDNNEQNVMSAIKTVPGNHSRGHYNQREIDVVKQEVLTNIPESSEVGIITPYNSQVDAFKRQIPSIETATVHKFQGREMNTIIMSTVDDQISEFSDDPNLLNVAISRAKKQFCIVLTGNEQEQHGNILELIDYISYNNFSVTNSKISSIFDYLYSRYTEQRISLMANSKNVSKFDSENLTYKLLTDIIAEYPEFGHLGVLCHMPMRNIIRDWSLMTNDEKQYISHYATHLDFLIINHVSKKPVLAIETDGYNYHNDKTDQHRRDLMKDHILEVYELPLLRLSTTGSGEYDKVLKMLKSILKK